jgi:hypothetical protein
MNRRTAIATMGVLPFTAPDPDPPEGERAAQFAIASAMNFFHGVMADEHVPLEHRLEAARGLIGGAIHLELDPLTRRTGFTY